MPINPIQPNMESKKSVNAGTKKPALKTTDNIKPLKPEGHLVHDTITSIPKFWIKDIQYDLKAIRDGFAGKTNDHQQGRLNDVGLKLGGVGIAAYLASRTSDPKLRLMEYLGLGSFLAAMSLYPKIAINAPSRLVHGFDIGKEYIDDQGRKKSVFQDSNYIPFDMYQGDFPGENLDTIGDRMGIPRDIKNRHDLIKEQMRKIATQNNTLWMLTAGIATPVMAALMCVGLEKLIVPVMESVRNHHANSIISKTLKETEVMSTNISNIESNSLSDKISDILRKYENNELPKEDYDKIFKIFSNKTEAGIVQGFEEDLAKLLQTNKKFVVDSDSIINVIKEQIPAAKRNELEKIFIPTSEEIDNILKNISENSNRLNEEEIRTLKTELRKLFEKKGADGHQYYKTLSTDLVNKISSAIRQKPVLFITKEQILKTENFAKIIGDFKSKEIKVDKAALIKFEESPQTILARYYENFENALFDVLEIKTNDIKQMRESEKYAKEILESKLEALTKDEAKYSKAIRKLSTIMSDMDVALHGKSATESNILDLIKAMENVYNKTAERLYELDKNIFSKTIDMLVKQDLSKQPLKNTIESRENLFQFLDGTLKPQDGLKENTLKYAEEMSKGVGSAKMNAVQRLVDRYQGVKNSFNRILLSMDNFKHGIPEGKYESEVAKIGREYLLHGSSSQFTQKFGLINNPELYRDVMFTTFNENNLKKETKDAFKKTTVETGNILERFELYIKRLREVMGNNDIDYSKPHHITGGNMNREYTQNALTRSSKFNLVAQDPVSMVKKAAERKYGASAWLKRVSIIGLSVLGAAVLAQFTFGKIKNPHNIQKQVSDDTNS